MKITDDEDILYFFSNPNEGYDKFNKIILDDLMPYCRCGSCHGVGVYRLNDKYEDEIYAFGDTLKDALIETIKKFRRENENNR